MYVDIYASIKKAISIALSIIYIHVAGGKKKKRGGTDFKGGRF